MREIKKLLRKELIEQRRSMDKNEKEHADNDIFEQIKPLLSGVSSVFTYCSTEIEVDTWRIINFCLKQGIPVALPISGETELTFHFIESTDELSLGRFSIYEPPANRPAVPDEKTLCIVPALCADGTGLRLGYGRGYYDRFLESFEGRSVILCYKAFKRRVPTEEHDRKADLTIFDR